MLRNENKKYNPIRSRHKDVAVQQFCWEILKNRRNARSTSNQEPSIPRMWTWFFCIKRHQREGIACTTGNDSTIAPPHQSNVFWSLWKPQFWKIGFDRLLVLKLAVHVFASFLNNDMKSIAQAVTTCTTKFYFKRGTPPRGRGLLKPPSQAPLRRTMMEHAPKLRHLFRVHSYKEIATLNLDPSCLDPSPRLCISKNRRNNWFKKLTSCYTRFAA